MLCCPASSQQAALPPLEGIYIKGAGVCKSSSWEPSAYPKPSHLTLTGIIAIVEVDSDALGHADALPQQLCLYILAAYAKLPLK